MFDRTYRNAPVEDVRATVNLLTRYTTNARGDAGPIDAYRALARQDARDSFYRPGDPYTRPTMNAAALDEYLGAPGARPTDNARRLQIVDPD